jgi:hypothetical protein
MYIRWYDMKFMSSCLLYLFSNYFVTVGILYTHHFQKWGTFYFLKTNVYLAMLNVYKVTWYEIYV